MRRSRTLLFAAVTAAAVALSGCSATVTGSPAPTGASTDGGAVAPTTDPVQWTDKVCGSLLGLQESLSTKPQFDENDPSAAVKALSAQAKKGIVCVRSTRVATGNVGRNVELDDNALGFVASMELNPQKSRVLLRLALLKTTDVKVIQRYFVEY